MQTLLGLILIVYLVGVGVVLAPVVEKNRTGASAADFTANVARELPGAFAWPATVFRSVTNREASAS